jgi:hypothetical protein
VQAHYTPEQLDSLEAQVAVTRRARVHTTTATQYSASVRKYFEWCDKAGRARTFSIDSLQNYAQFYIAGFGNVKVHAHTSFDSVLSAMADHATATGERFPHRKTERRRPLTRFLQGLQRRFPHVPVQDLPVTLEVLQRIADALGLRQWRDLLQCRKWKLAFWFRLILMHDCHMRSVATKNGMQRKDLKDCGGHFAVTVGRRASERKVKDRIGGRRVAILADVQHICCAGAVARVYLRRIRGRTPPGGILLPFVAKNDHVSEDAEPWGRFRQRVQQLLRQCNVPGRFGRSSMRAGGATDAFAQRASTHWVKHQGGWLSRQFERYDRPTTAQRAVVGAIYAKRALRAAASFGAEGGV